MYTNKIQSKCGGKNVNTGVVTWTGVANLLQIQKLLFADEMESAKVLVDVSRFYCLCVCLDEWSECPKNGFIMYICAIALVRCQKTWKN